MRTYEEFWEGRQSEHIHVLQRLILFVLNTELCSSSITKSPKLEIYVLAEKSMDR